MSTDNLVQAYLSLRGQREEIKRQYEEADALLKEEMRVIESAMLEVCNDVDASSIKTTHGTIIRKVNERFFCSDWDNFRKFVTEYDVLELLERRIHQGNFKAFMAENEKDGLPPGVNVMREYGITVRKAS